MPRLPVLTAHNTLEYPLWHEYVARVYHEAPEGDASLDLNTFSFFYTGDAYPATTELLHGPRRDPCLRVCTLRSWPDRPPIYEGTPFVGDAGPEAGVGRIGFFVHREPPLSREEVMAQVAGGPEHGGTLEVMHVRTDWLGGEVGVSWFFYAVGSGVRLDVTRLPKEGAVAVFADRQEWRDRHGGAQWPGDDHIRGHMEADRLSMLVFTRAGFSVFNQAGNNPSTEIIVRHAHDDSSELHSERGSCLDAPTIGIRLRTGLTARGTLACACSVRSELNCDNTPRGHVALPPPPSPPPSPPSPSPAPPLPPSAPASAVERVLAGMRTHGLLLKTSTCHGRYCMSNWNREAAFEWLGRTLQDRRLPPSVENDCGEWCSAFAFVHEDIPFVSAARASSRAPEKHTRTRCKRTHTSRQRACASREPHLTFLLPLRARHSLFPTLPVCVLRPLWLQTHFSHSGYLSGLTMVFDASPDLWENHVQCLSTTDSFSSMRSCCACFDPHFCTFENPQVGIPRS